MTDLVPRDQIETLVGAARHQTQHQGRVDTAEQRIYILHSHECLASIPDLRDCVYSLRLDFIVAEPDGWPKDQPFVLALDVLDSGPWIRPDFNTLDCTCPTSLDDSEYADGCPQCEAWFGDKAARRRFDA